MVPPFLTLMGKSFAVGAAGQIGITVAALAMPIIIKKVKDYRDEKAKLKEPAVDDALVPM